MAGGLGRGGALFRAGNAINGAFGKVGGAMVREAITGALSNVAQVAIQDETFKDGMDLGFERLFNGALKGAAVGAISAGVSEKLGDSVDGAMARGLRNADDVANLSRMQRLGQMLGPNGREMFKEGLSEAMGSSLGESAGVLLDYANGDFKGSFGDALKRIGQAGLRDMVSASGRAAAGAYNRHRYGELLAAARSQGGEPSPQQARALRLAGISAGVMHYDTPLREVQLEVHAGQQARQQLPAPLQHLANRLDAQTLTSLLHGLESGGFGTPKEKLAFIRSVASQIPGLDQRDFASQLNRALSDGAEGRAQREAEQAARRVEQKRVRNALLGDLPGPVRKALAHLDVEGFEGLPPAVLREAAALIAKGQFDASKAARLLHEATTHRPDLDESAFFERLLMATDTSRRAQAAQREDYLNGRRDLARLLPGSEWVWIRQVSEADMRRLQAHVRGEAPLSPGQYDALFRRVARQAPELRRADFDAALATVKQHHQEAQQVRIAQRQARQAQLQSLLETPRPSSRRERLALQRELLASLPAAQRHLVADTPILRVSDTEFAALTRSQSGEAVTLLVDGKMVVVLRESADPKVLREEGLHVLQSSDPAWRERVGMLDERKLAHWDDLPLSEQLALYGNKIVLEIDAQRRLIADLEGRLENGAGARARLELHGDLELARATLDNLLRRQAEVGGIDTLRMMEIESGLVTRPQWLDQPARLFTKGRAPADGDPFAPIERLLAGAGDTAQTRAVRRLLTEPSIIERIKGIKVESGKVRLASEVIVRILGNAPDVASAGRLLNMAARSGDASGFAHRLDQVVRALPETSRADLTQLLSRKSLNGEAVLKELARLGNGAVEPDSPASRLLDATLRLDVDQVTSLQHLADFMRDAEPPLHAAMATLLDSMASVTAAKLLKNIGATRDSIAELGLPADFARDLMLGLVKTAPHQRNSADFLITARSMFELLQGLRPSPNVDTVLDHLRAKLNGDMDTPAMNEDGTPQQVTPRDVGYDFSAAAKALQKPGDRAATVARFAEGIGRNGFMAEPDAWRARVSEAEQNWHRREQEHPEFAQLLRNLQQEQQLRGKEPLSEQDLHLLADIRPWFEDIVHLQQIREGRHFTPQQQLEFMAKLLSFSLGKGDARKGAILRPDGSLDDRNFDLRHITSSDLLGKVMSEIRTDAVGYTDEPDFNHKVMQEIEALGIFQLLDGRRMDHDALGQEANLENLIRQRHEYQHIIERSLAIAERMPRGEGGELHPDALALAEAQTRFGAKLTEVEGEIAALVAVLHAPEFADMKLMRGFEEGTGFDQIWITRGPDGRITDILLVEAKGKGAGLSDTKNKGFQMSEQWVAATLREMQASNDKMASALASELESALAFGARISGIVVGSDTQAGSEVTVGRDKTDKATEGNYAPVSDSASGHYDAGKILRLLRS
ncbi:MAG TPA: hypothetical protein VNR18_08015 [Hyphomicrobiales bacterium]|nr:hypothetical protein [Hyphomicrobiales bacterium]